MLPLQTALPPLDKEKVAPSSTAIMLAQRLPANRKPNENNNQKDDQETMRNQKTSKSVCARISKGT